MTLKDALTQRYTVYLTYGVTNEYHPNCSIFDIERMSHIEDMETGHSLMEGLQSILQLAIGQSMYFQPHRDDNTSKGIITRIY